MGLAIDRNVAPDDGWIGAEFASPVAVRQHHGFRASRSIVGIAKPPSQHRRHTQNRKDAVRDIQNPHPFGLRHARYADGIAMVEADILESAALLAKNEVVRR